MDIFLARQPIFNRIPASSLLRTFSLHLLQNYFMGGDGDIATSELISNAFLDNRIDRITKSRRAFVYITNKILEDEVANFAYSGQ